MKTPPKHPPPPSQAVILAGGRGLRLKPITDSLPKPMVRFHNKPFLEYLIEQLKEQGFTRILMLLGYLPEVIQDYFGNGEKFGIAIDYSVTNVNNDTGTRIRLAEEKLDPCFLLLYGDNYWPMRFSDMWAHYQACGCPAMLTVYSNKDGFSRDNMRIGDSSRVELYDKTRTASGLRGVEIGYGIFTKDIVDRIPENNVNFEKSIYPELVKEHALSAFLTDHRYYSLSTPDRLPAIKQFFKPKKAVILDRDGVLNVKPPRWHYVTKWEEFIWIEGSIEAIRLLKKHGYLVFIISNQAGIARGIFSQDDLDLVHQKMKEELNRHDADVDKIYVCPHHWDDDCECRKPKPGMIFSAQRDFHLNLTHTPVIGDDPRDIEAGKRAGCPGYLVTEQETLLDVVRKYITKDRRLRPLNPPQGDL